MAFDQGKVLGIHALTTSYYGNYEMLELAMVNGKGEVQFHERFKPRHAKRWPKTQKAHGITYGDVKDKHEAIWFADEIDRVVRSARVIAAYPDYFHVSAVKNSGIECGLEDKRSVNVMELHARNYLERTEEDIYWFDEDGDRHRRKYPKSARAVTMAEAVHDFPNVRRAIGWGDAGDAVWGAAASALMYVEMCARGDKGASKALRYEGLPSKLTYMQRSGIQREVLRAAKGENGAVPVSDKSQSPCLARLDEAGIEYIDNRDRGGSLWVIGDSRIERELQELGRYGLRFHYKENGGKATGGKPGWWSK